MLEPFFSTRLKINLNGMKKKTKYVKNYGMIKQCSVFKFIYISHGATVISRISFHKSEQNHEQDTGKSLVAFQSLIINTNFSKKF